MQSAPDVRRFARVASGLVLALSLAGCAGTLDQVTRSGTSPTPAPVKAKAKTTRRVYYSTTEGTKVYAEPSGSSKVVGSLSLNERVLRTKVDRGYALIESSGSGLKGWVDNARLTWKAPGASTATAPTTAAPTTAAPTTTAPAPTPVEEPETEETEEEETAAEPAPEPPPAEAPPAVVPTRKPTPAGVGPSIFNPY